MDGIHQGFIRRSFLTKGNILNMIFILAAIVAALPKSTKISVAVANANKNEALGSSGGVGFAEIANKPSSGMVGDNVGSSTLNAPIFLGSPGISSVSPTINKVGNSQVDAFGGELEKEAPGSKQGQGMNLGMVKALNEAVKHMESGGDKPRTVLPKTHNRQVEGAAKFMGMGHVEKLGAMGAGLPVPDGSPNGLAGGGFDWTCAGITKTDYGWKCTEYGRPK
jgi:hypothetical protein